MRQPGSVEDLPKITEKSDVEKTGDDIGMSLGLENVCDGGGG